MKWLIRIFIAVVILGAICFGGYVVYNVAYATGETTGYDRGYSEGESVGYSSGKQEGYGEGYTSGKLDGHAEGYTSGRQDGYTEGYDSGKADGYEEGIEAGLGHGYTLKDPTYEQAVTFITEDKTDSNEYVEDTYVCSHFARDVCNNAEKEGLRCAFVEIRFPGEGHSIIAFETIDEGFVYFDAITDDRVRPIIGKRYYQCIEPKPGYYYTKPPYDDTIKDILIIW